MYILRSWTLRAAIILISTSMLNACSEVYKDESIEKQFQKQLARDNNLAHVTVKVQNGVVDLYGNCPSESCRTYAEQSVKEIKGVKTVINHISIDTTSAGM
jgi:osmotically-inducible protein OsmY